jgi:Zn-dependent protease with chaperone function
MWNMPTKSITFVTIAWLLFSFSCIGQKTVTPGAPKYRQVKQVEPAKQVNVVRRDTISLNGYAEFLKGSYLIVEGQKIAADRGTEFKGLSRNLASIPPGSEVKIRGIRRSDGVIQALKIESKPNGNAFMEADILKISDTVESAWVKEGMLFNESAEGKRDVIGKIIETGPQVRRVRNITMKLLPPYLDPSRVRVRVVETEEWNASVMGNGAVWVYSGLLDSVTDDELAVILGHELAHYTHEHSRRQAKRGFISQILGVAATIGAQSVDSGAGKTVTSLGTMLGLTTWMSGYSRGLESQADRVGVRYAHEAGYDVKSGVVLWEKFRKKYGDQDSFTNFFVGSHPTPSERIENMQREIAMNYSGRN